MKRTQFLSIILVCVFLLSTVLNTVSLANSSLDTEEYESDYECKEEKKTTTIKHTEITPDPKIMSRCNYEKNGYLLITYADGVDSTSLSYDDCFYCYAWPDANDNAPTPESDLSIMIDDCTFYRVKENPKMFFGIVNKQTIAIEYWGKNLQNAPEMLQSCFEIKKISDIFQD